MRGDQILLENTGVICGDDFPRLPGMAVRDLQRSAPQGHRQRPVCDDVLVAGDAGGNALGLEAGAQNVRFPGIKVARDGQEHGSRVGIEAGCAVKQWPGSGVPCRIRVILRHQDRGSSPKTRSSWSQRQAFATRAAHATASSRVGSSSTVKPPLSGGAHG